MADMIRGAQGHHAAVRVFAAQGPAGAGLARASRHPRGIGGARQAGGPPRRPGSTVAASGISRWRRCADAKEAFRVVAGPSSATDGGRGPPPRAAQEFPQSLDGSRQAAKRRNRSRGSRFPSAPPRCAPSSRAAPPARSVFLGIHVREADAGRMADEEEGEFDGGAERGELRGPFRGAAWLAGANTRRTPRAAAASARRTPRRSLTCPRLKTTS